MRVLNKLFSAELDLSIPFPLPLFNLLYCVDDPSRSSSFYVSFSRIVNRIYHCVLQSVPFRAFVLAIPRQKRPFPKSPDSTLLTIPVPSAKEASLLFFSRMAVMSATVMTAVLAEASETYPLLLPPNELSDVRKGQRLFLIKSRPYSSLLLAPYLPPLVLYYSLQSGLKRN